MCKDVLMMTEFANHHPDLKEQLSLLTNHPQGLATTYWAEQTIAYLGNHTREDAEGYDLIHNETGSLSEVKTTSISETPNKKKDGTAGNSAAGSITGVQTAAGNLKKGSLRVVLFNPYKDKLQYFYIPVRDLPKLVTKTPPGTPSPISYSYNIKADIIPKLAAYEFPSLEIISAMTDEKYEEYLVERSDAVQRVKQMVLQWGFTYSDLYGADEEEEV